MAGALRRRRSPPETLPLEGTYTDNLTDPSQQSTKTAFGRLFDPWDAFPARRPYSQGSRTARPNENRFAMHDDAVCRQWNRDARRTRSRPTSPANPTIAEKTIPFHAEVPCTNLLPPIHRGNQNSRRNTRRGARKSAPKGTIYGTTVPRTAAGGAPCASISKQTESHAWVRARPKRPRARPCPKPAYADAACSPGPKARCA